MEPPINFSLIEDDYVSPNFDVEFFSGSYENHALSILAFLENAMEHVITDVLRVVSSIAALLLLYILLSSKRLKTTANVFVLNFAILALFQSGILPILSWLLVIAFGEYLMYSHFYCVMVRSEGFFSCGIINIAFSMAIFWYAKNYKSEILVKYRNLHLILICGAYIVSVIVAIWLIYDCFTPHFHSDIFSACLYFMQFLMICAILYKTRKSEAKYDNYLSFIAKLIIFCYFPFITFSTLYLLVHLIDLFDYSDPHLIYSLVNLVMYFTLILIASLPITVLIVYRKRNSRFKSELDRIVCCRKHEELNEEEQDEDDNDDETQIVQNQEEISISNANFV